MHVRVFVLNHLIPEPLVITCMAFFNKVVPEYEEQSVRCHCLAASRDCAKVDLINVHSSHQHACYINLLEQQKMGMSAWTPSQTYVCQ